MASDVEICNLALSNIRGGSINNLQTDSSVQAENCRLKYPMMRDMLLSRMLWGFAAKIDALAVLSTPLFNWNYAYTYPSDCLRIDRLILDVQSNATPSSNVYRVRNPDSLNPADLGRQVQYQIMNQNGTRIISANDQNLRISYTSRVTDTQMFSDSFIMALSWLLSAELAIPIVGAELGRSLRSDAMTMYQGYFDAAVADSLNEQYNEQPNSEFITIRN